VWNLECYDIRKEVPNKADYYISKPSVTFNQKQNKRHQTRIKESSSTVEFNSNNLGIKYKSISRFLGHE